VAGELEQIEALVRGFNDDAADRRALAAAVANAYTNGRALGPGTVATVTAVMGRTKTVADAVTEIEAESGGEVFGPDFRIREEATGRPR
jgi:hypothetical protein